VEVLFVLIRVLAPVDWAELEEAQALGLAGRAGAAARTSGLDVLSRGIRLRGCGGQREEARRARLDPAESLLAGRHLVLRRSDIGLDY
jgi:hypothetical protein